MDYSHKSKYKFLKNLINHQKNKNLQSSKENVFNNIMFKKTSLSIWVHVFLVIFPTSFYNILPLNNNLDDSKFQI